MSRDRKLPWPRLMSRWLCVITLLLGVVACVIVNLDSIELANPSANRILPGITLGLCVVGVGLVFVGWVSLLWRSILAGCAVALIAGSSMLSLGTWFTPVVEEVGRIGRDGVQVVVHRVNFAAFKPYALHFRLERPVFPGFISVDVVYRVVGSEVVLANHPGGFIRAQMSSYGRGHRDVDSILIKPDVGALKLVPRGK